MEDITHATGDKPGSQFSDVMYQFESLFTLLWKKTFLKRQSSNDKH